MLTMKKLPGTGTAKEHELIGAGTTEKQKSADDNSRVLSVARTTSRLQGSRWRVHWVENISKLPRRSFREGVEHLAWNEALELIDYLTRIGNQGTMTVSELLVALDRYLNRTETDDHEAAYRVRCAVENNERRERLNRMERESEGRSHVERHLIWRKYEGKLPRLASFYRRIAVRKVGA